MNSSFLRRLGFYLGGFALGLVILAFFLQGKNASCSYFPDARVLKNINTKPLVYSDHVKAQIINEKYDSLQINYILKKGDVNFSKSETQLDSCKVYVIEGLLNEKEVAITVKNCEKEALLTNIASNN